MTVQTLRMRQLVRQVQDETGSVDPREIAAKVAAALSDAEVRSALVDTLPEFVRQVMSSGRKNAFVAPPAPSAKVAAVRDWFERLMSQPVDVSGEGGRWKALRDCTREDLLSVAAYRRDIAARNVATAEQYEALAAAVPAGKTVGELPAETVGAVFGRAAA